MAIDVNQVTVSPKFQVVIPKEIRDQLGLKPGMKLKIVTIGNRIELLPIGPIRKLKGILKGMNTEVFREEDRF